MNKKKVLQEAESWVKDIVSHDKSGHDWHHIERVRNMAKRIAEEEKEDSFLIEIMALFHEVPDRKIAGHGNEASALETVRKWLKDHAFSDEDIEEVLYVIANQSYSKSTLQGKTLKSKRGQIVQDADRLEAIGAIGIARCFAFTGNRNNPIHDPTIPPNLDKTHDQYTKDDDTAINHFYEKLLLLNDHINTNAGKRIAQHRHDFMKLYLDEFFAEWDGKQ